MVEKIGFDNEKYLIEQKKAILERVKKFGNLYLEFGGKLIGDYHAARVLPGFDPDVKIKLLSELKDKADILLCIYAGDIERRKLRGDFGTTYDIEARRLIDDLRQNGIEVTAVVITRFEDQPSVEIFKRTLEGRGIRVYTHRRTRGYSKEGYPVDLETIISNEGYGANEYIKTKNPLVVVTGPGPGSGKLTTCLSQLYHNHRKKRKAGYAKFETFPIWNLPLDHPINVAYEAATADIGDKVVIDHFHLGEKAVNYNRDVESFQILERILREITGESPYKSPTEMGVNKAGFAITDDGVIREAARQEIIRRFFRYACEKEQGHTDQETVDRVKILMANLGLKEENRKVVNYAAETFEKAKQAKENISCAAAIELSNGEIVTAKNSPDMHVASSLVLNAVRKLTGIPDTIPLLSRDLVEDTKYFKKDKLCIKTPSVALAEVLILLNASAKMSPTAKLAIEKLKELRGCEVHMTHISSPIDEAVLREELGVNLTVSPCFSSAYLYEK